MRLPRLLALTAAAALLAGCNDNGKDTAATELPDVVTTTSAAASPTATRSVATRPATPTASATRAPTPVKTAAPSPTARRTTARPMATATTARPTPRPTTAKPTPAPTKPPATGTFDVSMKNTAFSPKLFSVPRGTTVRVTNNDPITHTWTSNSGLWDSGNMGFGQRYSYRFMVTGAFNFRCTVKGHEDMTGQVKVT